MQIKKAKLGRMAPLGPGMNDNVLELDDKIKTMFWNGVELQIGLAGELELRIIPGANVLGLIELKKEKPAPVKIDPRYDAEAADLLPQAPAAKPKKKRGRPPKAKK